MFGGEGGEWRPPVRQIGSLAELTALPIAAVKQIAAVVIEPLVQGAAGMKLWPKGTLAALREWTKGQGILLIADEVQCGYGRTGRMWAFEGAAIVPDVVCLAKAIANGLPLGAIVSRRELHDRWGKGAHGTTFGGNPVACAAGLAVLETIRAEGLVACAAERGSQLRDGLERLAATDEGIGDVRGPGLMVGVEFVRDRETREPDGERADRVIARCADMGLLLLTCGTGHQVVRWIPPLNVAADEINEGLGIFQRALESG